MHNVAIELADVDRGVYETLALKVARHPSETEEFFATRLLAYALECSEGITFSRGLSEPDEPAITVRDLTGALVSWIEIGMPAAARLHKASKASPRVAVYIHKAAEPYRKQLAGERIHRADEIEIYAIERELLTGLASRLDRRMAMDISVNERQMFVTIGGTTLEGKVERVVIGAE